MVPQAADSATQHQDMSQIVHTDVKQSSGKIAMWLVRVLVQCYISSNFQKVVLDRLNQPPS